MAQKLDQQVDRMIGLIHSLLDTTRIAEGQLMLTPSHFDINELIAERIETLRPTSNKHVLKLVADKNAFINADRERIGEVLNNLISNAIKYSPTDKKITIRSSVKENGVEISIQDKGIGISDEAKEKIFERFYRLPDPRLATYPGMGLGLYIAAGIIHLHGGKIWVESEINKGSTFYFFLPYNNDQ